MQVVASHFAGQSASPSCAKIYRACRLRVRVLARRRNCGGSRGRSAAGELAPSHSADEVGEDSRSGDECAVGFRKLGRRFRLFFCGCREVEDHLAVPEARRRWAEKSVPERWASRRLREPAVCALAAFATPARSVASRREPRGGQKSAMLLRSAEVSRSVRASGTAAAAATRAAR